MLPVAMLGIIATSPGQTFGVAVFNESLRESLELSHSSLALAYMLGTLLAAIPIIYIGSLMDRFGLRASITGAVILFGCACLVMSRVDSFGMLLFAFFLLRLLGPGTLAFLSGNTLSFWFHRRLGTAEGIRQVGTAGAIALMPMLNLWLKNLYGWRDSYVILGFSVWIVMLPVMFLLFRNRPEDVGQTLDGLPEEVPPSRAEIVKPDTQIDYSLRETMRMRSFWAVVGGSCLFSMILTAIIFSLIPIVQARGFSETNATNMLSVFAISMASLNLIGGFLADRYPVARMLGIGLALLGIGILTLLTMSSSWQGLLSGCLLGSAQGLYGGASGPLWARFYGRLHMGKIRGLLMTSNVACSSLGPFLVGSFRDLLGNYQLILILFAVVTLPAAMLALRVTPPVRQPQAVLAES